MKLTEKICESAKPKFKMYKISDGGGLILQVNPSGSKYWRYNYRLFEKHNTLSFGNYPEVSLKEARKAHEEAHKLVSQKIDPSLERKKNKVIQKYEADSTFELIAREWLEKRKSEIKPGTYKEIYSRLQRELFPRIGRMPIKSITAPILLDTLRIIENRGVYETLRRIRQYTSQIFQFAIATGRADSDPATPLTKALKSPQVVNQKALPLEMLPEFWNKLNNHNPGLMKQSCLGLKLIILTMVRKAELALAEWKEISFEERTWIIPASRMKMKRPHIVPLSDQALEIFKELKEMACDLPNVFPGKYDPYNPIIPDTLLRALYSFGYKNIATIHGFRSLAMTVIIEKLGYRYEIPDLQLAHSKGDSIRAAYDRSQFLDERRKMMQEWADYVEKISAK